MPRFYCQSMPDDGQDTFVLPDEVAHHAVRVRRLKVGDRLDLFDGQGLVCQATVTVISKKQVQVEQIVRQPRETRPDSQLVLAQSLVSQEKMDWVIQKAVELGVTAIQPLQTQRSSVRLTAERQLKRQQHWEKVIISACEQCGQNFLPEMAAPETLTSWLSGLSCCVLSKYLLMPEADNSLNAGEADATGELLVIGPEGGFTQEESQQMQAAGFKTVRLGPRTLRAETAAVAALAVMQYRRGGLQ